MQVNRVSRQLFRFPVLFLSRSVLVSAAAHHTPQSSTAKNSNVNLCVLDSIFDQTRCFSKMAETKGVKFLGQDEAINIDRELFDVYQFSVDQLMELAGLACAHSVATVYNVKSHPRILIAVGPGNNGGDGLVCARHLKLFGYQPTVLYPRASKSELMSRLVNQVTMMDVPILSSAEEFSAESLKNYDVIIDALFGFSFKPPAREPYLSLLAVFAQGNVPIASVDIPSGWNVESGPGSDSDGPVLRPDMLISLTAPKLCAKYFTGKHHFLGGRFVPKRLAEKYDLNLPDYPELTGIVRL